MVCIGNDRGMVPTILADGRGFTVASGDAVAIADRLAALADDPGLVAATGRRAAAWAGGFSLDRFEAELRRLLDVAWADGSRFAHPPALRDRVATDRPTVVQVVDSLAAGGAERVAVHLANELARRGHRSLLVATRAGGPLAADIDPSVEWVCLGRRGPLDPGAARALRRFVRDHDVDVIHAHSTSVFVVASAFPVGRRPAIVWHDHFPGAPERSPWALRAVSPSHRRGRGRQPADRGGRPPPPRPGWPPHLAAQLLPARASGLDGGGPAAADLPGEPGRRVVCVANLRPAKDQLTLVRAMARVLADHPGAHLLLVGADVGGYAEEVRAEVRALGLEHHVTFLGVRTDVGAVLAASDVAVLSSLEEGTPLAVHRVRPGRAGGGGHRRGRGGGRPRPRTGRDAGRARRRPPPWPRPWSPSSTTSRNGRRWVPAWRSGWASASRSTR